jgi:site-specific DNA-methyltransferase (adenine-specific)
MPEIPKYSIGNGTLYQGNSLTVLKKIESESVDICITSPPYLGLRSYSADPILWGGDPECEHEWGDEQIGTNRRELFEDLSDKQSRNRGTNIVYSQGKFCQKCLGWMGSLGSEPRPDLFISHLVQIFSEVNRVLKKTGNLFVNIGDSYAGSIQGAGTSREGSKQETNRGTRFMWDKKHKSVLAKVEGIPPKNLLGIPWQLAFALRDTGWYLRNDNIWAKGVSGQEEILEQIEHYGELVGIDQDKMKNLISLLSPFVGNPMPENVLDRHSRSHEYFFHLSKSRKYYFDMSLIKEPDRMGGYRNRRTVWEVMKTVDKTSHTAAFPEELIRPLILAGCPQDGVVLDCFAGSGTVPRVAEKLGRKWIGIEISEEYCQEEIIPSIKKLEERLF